MRLELSLRAYLDETECKEGEVLPVWLARKAYVAAKHDEGIPITEQYGFEYLFKMKVLYGIKEFLQYKGFHYYKPINIKLDFMRQVIELEQC